MEYLSLYGMECRTIPRVLHNISLKFGKQSYNIFLLSLVLLNNKLLNYKEHINMQELTLTTPSLLFSAVSLILLAYTNRFISYASLVRTLKEKSFGLVVFNIYLELISCRCISKALTEIFISQIHTHSEAANRSNPIPNIQAAMICHEI